MRIDNGSTNPPHNQPADDDNDTRTIVDLCDAYLDSLPVSSWGRAWYIESDDDRRQAAIWLATTIEGVMNSATTKRGE